LVVGKTCERMASPLDFANDQRPTTNDERPTTNDW